jgi:hypothetical protein
MLVEMDGCMAREMRNGPLPRASGKARRRTARNSSSSCSSASSYGSCPLYASAAQTKPHVMQSDLEFGNRDRQRAATRRHDDVASRAASRETSRAERAEARDRPSLRPCQAPGVLFLCGAGVWPERCWPIRFVGWASVDVTAQISLLTRGSRPNTTSAVVWRPLPCCSPAIVVAARHSHPQSC